MAKSQKRTVEAERVAPPSPLKIRPETLTIPYNENGRRICPPYPVAKLMKKGADGKMRIPSKYLEALEQNQKISSCCRHPENHTVEGLKSKPEEPAPDIYIFHCTCGRQHRRFCIGGDDERPIWIVG